ncbi:hypothetical protein IMCC21224_111618 [Puniceibacterium sp. IMCC21224]|nr:hypothetical protein IMCC21224_111618 [Puniceibacterium sp. IMCC21224]
MIAESNDPMPGTRAKSIRVASAAVSRSLRPPLARQAVAPEQPPLVAEVRTEIDTVLAEIQDVQANPVVVALAVMEANGVAPDVSIKPMRRPSGLVLASASAVTAKAPAPATPAAAPRRARWSNGSRRRVDGIGASISGGIRASMRLKRFCCALHSPRCRR